ncbi:M1 family metallopeptidase [Ferruginibacter sp. SUN106]|uniref:M1 family metallopeptidase n=1 Tax=Ferruginibacter sp. SUN106 TaxID=2978348 RepID=UPI003D369EDE
MRFKFLSLINFCFFVFSGIAHAQNNTSIDVQHYTFDLILSDNTDTINGTAIMHIKFLKNTSSIQLDLGNINSSGKGMQVISTMTDLKLATFEHNNDKLLIRLHAMAKAGDSQTVIVKYKGIPADGLIISKNLFNKRTFFGDNWPDRARYWLPCNDIPSDKASVAFIVTAPSHYSIVSNGVMTDEHRLNDSVKLTHWKEDVPLPTKVMVIGAADFAVSDAGYAGDIPVTSWVYQDDKEQGFYDYAKAKDILQYFINYIGPYGYKKLANVQSKTIFGGMENAGAIFYFERSVTGKGKVEDLLAHEIAHQWFGDMVTESNFKHLWLSEGFATYLTDIYLESKYGRDSMLHRLGGERDKVIDFTKRTLSPVIDTTSNYKKLLNANSYQKGAWVLHMLRNKVGDSVFKNIIREQYRKYAGSNASSENFIATAEKLSHQHLQVFFKQWLYKPGIPVVSTDWKYDPVKKKVLITIGQQQAGLFSFPMEFLLITEKGKLLKSIPVQKRKTVKAFSVNEKVIDVIPDPNTQLLWQAISKYTVTVPGPTSF